MSSDFRPDFAQITPEDFTYLTRIHYLAPSDGLWGEHEIDYILFAQKNVDFTPNLNEVSETMYVVPFASTHNTNSKRWA
jgi:isopentenyl-diphosphate delta-isomerase